MYVQYLKILRLEKESDKQLKSVIVKVFLFYYFYFNYNSLC